MRLVDITEVMVTSIEEVIYKNWKHEGAIHGWSTGIVWAEIDGKYYGITVKEVDDWGDKE